LENQQRRSLRQRLLLAVQITLQLHIRQPQLGNSSESSRRLAARVDSQNSEYEHDNRRVHAARLSTIAHLLQVSVDELLGHKPSKANGAASLKLVRRLKAIEALPPQRQKFVLQTLDALLRVLGTGGVEKRMMPCCAIPLAMKIDGQHAVQARQL
jgi:hypothetical protein